MDCDLYIVVQAKCWEEDTLHILEGHGTLRLIVDIEAQNMLVQVEQHTYDGTNTYTALTPIRVCVVVNEPASVAVNVHGPRLVVLPQHGILGRVQSCDAKGRVWMIVVPVDGHLPVVDTLGEANVPQDNAVILVVAGKCHVLVREDDVLVGCPRVRVEPSNCGG